MRTRREVMKKYPYRNGTGIFFVIHWWTNRISDICLSCPFFIKKGGDKPAPLPTFILQYFSPFPVHLQIPRTKKEPWQLPGFTLIMIWFIFYNVCTLCKIFHIIPNTESAITVITQPTITIKTGSMTLDRLARSLFSSSSYIKIIVSSELDKLALSSQTLMSIRAFIGIMPTYGSIESYILSHLPIHAITLSSISWYGGIQTMFFNNTNRSTYHIQEFNIILRYLENFMRKKYLLIFHTTGSSNRKLKKYFWPCSLDSMIVMINQINKAPPPSRLPYETRKVEKFFNSVVVQGISTFSNCSRISNIQGKI